MSKRVVRKSIAVVMVIRREIIKKITQHTHEATDTNRTAGADGMGTGVDERARLSSAKGSKSERRRHCGGSEGGAPAVSNIATRAALAQK